MDTATLAQAMGSNPGVDYTKFTAAVNEALTASNCTTTLRAAHFLAQIGHESAGLRYMREIDPGHYLENRRDIGNDRPGDGPKYRGAGPLQITGKLHFRNFGKWCHGRGLVSDPEQFVKHPEQLEQPRWGLLAASWYWTVARPNLNSQADRDDLVAVTRSINGGTNGIADRRARLDRCKALGARLLPTGQKEKPMEPNHAHRGDPTFLPALLRAWGVTVVEMDAWRDRGEGDFTDIIGIIAHHTAGPTTSAQYIAANPGLENGLSAQIHLARDGVATICGAGVAWHAGGDEARTPAWAKGQVQIRTRHPNKWQSIGNAKTIGIEAVNAGDGTQAWPEKQVDAYARVCAAICWYLGLPVDRVIGHKEFAPSRKIDPNFDMSAFRRRVQTHLNNPPTSQEDTMNQAQERMLREIHHQLLNPWGQLGKKTLVDAVAEMRTELRLAGDQLAGPGRTDKGARTFAGWDLATALAAARKKKLSGVTLVEGLAVLLLGTDDDIAAIRKTINKETN